MNTSYIKFLSAFAFVAFASQGVQAQELKIRYVNQDRVFSEAALSRPAEARKAELEKRRQELDDMATRLKVSGEKFDKESPTLSEADRIRRSREIGEQERELQRRTRAFQEDLALWKQEETGNLRERTQRVINQISELEKLDLVLIDAVVFLNPKLDITEKVIRALNAQTTGK
jgi:outer membrane protein